MEQQNGIRLGDLLMRVYIAVKRKIVLMLAVILIITGGGLAIAYLRKPMYTASECVSYKASESMTNQYFQTVVGFCNKGCVIDRANYYYDCYVKKDYKNVNQFLDDVGTSVVYDTSKRLEQNKYIFADRVSVVASSSNSNTAVSYIFTVRYKDVSQSGAQEKIVILLKAIGDEINLQNGEAVKYFSTNITINDLGTESIMPDWSKTKILLIAFIVGVIVALLFVFLINFVDNTVQEKEELERLTGADLFAFIDDQGA